MCECVLFLFRARLNCCGAAFSFHEFSLFKIWLERNCCVLVNPIIYYTAVSISEKKDNKGGWLLVYIFHRNCRVISVCWFSTILKCEDVFLEAPVRVPKLRKIHNENRSKNKKDSFKEEEEKEEKHLKLWQYWRNANRTLWEHLGMHQCFQLWLN